MSNYTKLTKNEKIQAIEKTFQYAMHTIATSLHCPNNFDGFKAWAKKQLAIGINPRPILEAYANAINCYDLVRELGYNVHPNCLNSIVENVEEQLTFTLRSNGLLYVLTK